ncbi:glycosyltransferase [uncultured Gelidibacter sp.]|uniref:glycosyltransferase family 2 protein n=1 Tax=uncultured Gelidibacter sp. TaxID=259318 RepID=UPI002638C274|nr:glycosyltransferase [uncultured Gelidibacter sp.]
MSYFVSIIIPTYNRSAYIADALTSIRDQTYKNWECIVVDDGSSDNTGEIVKRFVDKDARFKYYKRRDDFPKGANGSRNFGLSKSIGSFIAFCDDDDYWLFDKLDKQITIFKNHPEVGLVTSNIEFVNANGVRTGRVIIQKHNHGYVFQEFLLKNRISMITPLVKKEVFEKVGLFNTDFHYNEDWEFWRRVAYYYQFYSIQEVLACVRKHDENSSLTFSQSPFEQYKIYSRLNKALLTWGQTVFSKKDKHLIAISTWKRYKQIQKNHCPGILPKLKLFTQSIMYDKKQFLYLVYYTIFSF